MTKYEWERVEQNLICLTEYTQIRMVLQKFIAAGASGCVSDHGQKKPGPYFISMHCPQKHIPSQAKRKDIKLGRQA
jgi:hypothetical protein